jgi:hypothetical protein
MNNLERYFGSVADAADALARCVTCFTCPAVPDHCEGRHGDRDCEECLAEWLTAEGEDE